MAINGLVKLSQLLKKNRLNEEVRRSNIPELPVELILHVFTLAASDPLATRPSTLSLLSRVCQTANDWAIPRLYSSPELLSPEKVSLFKRTVKKNARLAEQVKGLAVDGLSRDPGELAGYRKKVTPLLPAILKSCPNLVDLTIASTVIFSTEELLGAENIQSLTLTNTLYCPRTSSRKPLPSSLFPSLRALTLNSAEFSTSSVAILSSTQMPRLERLDLNICTLISDPYTLRKVGLVDLTADKGGRELLEGLEEVSFGPLGTGVGSQNGWECERKLVRACKGLKLLEAPRKMLDGM